MLRLAFALALCAGPALAQPITPAAVSAFVAERQRTWNARAFDAYFAGFTPDARFTDQAYVGDKPPVPYGTSTLAQAQRQVRRAAARSRETARISALTIAPDGRTAQVSLQVVSTLDDGGKTRTLCAARVMALTTAHGSLRAARQTDTIFRCRR